MRAKREGLLLYKAGSKGRQAGLARGPTGWRVSGPRRRHAQAGALISCKHVRVLAAAPPLAAPMRRGSGAKGGQCREARRCPAPVYCGTATSATSATCRAFLISSSMMSSSLARAYFLWSCSVGA